MRIPRFGETLAAFLRGASLAFCLALLSFAAASWGFKRSYYLGVLLPLGAVLLLLLAWLLYLRDDGLARRAKAPGAEGGREDRRSATRGRPRPSPALLWAALFLALLATALYAFAGIGASFFL